MVVVKSAQTLEPIMGSSHSLGSVKGDHSCSLSLAILFSKEVSTE